MEQILKGVATVVCILMAVNFLCDFIPPFPPVTTCTYFKSTAVTDCFIFVLFHN